MNKESPNIQFSQTNSLRLVSIICLGIGIFFVLLDKYLAFCIFILAALCLEIIRSRLYAILLHNYQVKLHHHTDIKRQAHEVISSQRIRNQ